MTAAIVEDARHPTKYRMLLSMVDVIFADVAQPDQARIVSINAEHFLKNGGHAVISIKANCVDSTIPAEQVFAHEVQWLRENKFKPLEQITLEPYERVSVSRFENGLGLRSFCCWQDHAIVCAVYQRHQ